jgi:DNA-binding transcriptional ArsR family regulator
MPPGPSELITAVNHPLRRRLLRVFVDEARSAASASEMAQATGEPLARVAYHLKTLTGCGILRLVRRSDEDGVEKPFYAWALAVDPQWLRLMLDFWAQSGLAD